MPRVPSYDGAQVREAPLQGGMLQPARSDIAFGGGQARQLGALAEAGQRAQTAYDNEQAKIKYRDDVAKADAAFVKLQGEYAETAIKWKSTRVGANAEGITEDANKWWADAQTRYNDGLDDQQRALLAQHAARFRTTNMADVLAFQENEKKKFSINAANAFIGTQVQAAAENPAMNAATSRQAIRSKLVEQKVLHGWNDDMLNQEMGKQVTVMHTEVVRSLISKGDPQEAQRYFESALKLGDFNETVASDMRLQIKKAADAKTASDLAVEVSGLPTEKALATIREKAKDPEIMKSARQQFLLAKNDEDLVRQAREKGASDTVWQDIANKRKPRQEDLAAMDGKERIQVENYFAALAKAVAANGRLHAKEDNYQVLDDVEEKVRSGDITQTAQLERYAPHLRPETFRTLRKSLEKRSEVSRTELEKMFSDRVGKPRSKWGDGERKQWLAFQDYISANVAETKRPEDLEKWGDRWFMKGYGKDDSIFRSDPSTFGEAKTKARSDFLIQTPEANRSGVDQALAVLKLGGVKIPTGTSARDEFYTNHYLDASRWFAARNEEVTPGRAAAYAVLVQNKKPVTRANINAVLEQLRGAASAGSGQPAR